jgi:hypothetical protein
MNLTVFWPPASGTVGRMERRISDISAGCCFQRHLTPIQSFEVRFGV